MKSALQATTPFPNALLDDVMPHLKDTEWRVLCVIVRQTLGWQEKGKTHRKERDWLTRDQLKTRTGRNAEALSAAIDTLVRKGYIIADNGQGKPLITASARRENHSRIYYGLAPGWTEKPGAEKLKKEQRKSEHSKVFRHTEQCSVLSPAVRKTELVNAGKANTTKETLTKENETKSNQERKIADNSYCVQSRENSENPKETAADLFCLQATTQAGSACHTPSVTQAVQMSDSAKSFTAHFKNQAAQYGHINPNTALSFPDAARLEALLVKYGNLDWTPFLQMFFQSDQAYICRLCYALSAFIHTSNIILLRSPGPSPQPKPDRPLFL